MRLLLLFFGSLLIVTNSYATKATGDYILIEKSRHMLTIYNEKKPIKTYKVSIGKGGLAAKEVQGDNLTPEGIYKIDSRNKNSGFYKALHISYPNSSDIIRAKQKGKNPGGDIMIHGLKNGLGWIGGLHRLKDWTQGCIAVTNAEIDEIWNLVPDDTLVEIRK